MFYLIAFCLFTQLDFGILNFGSCLLLNLLNLKHFARTHSVIAEDESVPQVAELLCQLQQQLLDGDSTAVSMVDN